MHLFVCYECAWHGLREGNENNEYGSACPKCYNWGVLNVERMKGLVVLAESRRKKEKQ